MSISETSGNEETTHSADKAQLQTVVQLLRLFKRPFKFAHIDVHVTAIIPAKTDSTRLLKKNLRMINGKTLIEYAIDYAIKSEYVKDIVV